MTKPLESILVVRLGAMGDVLHALPAAASLKHSFPAARLTWAVDALWAPLLAHNPFIDSVIEIDRKRPRTWWLTRQALLKNRYCMAVDFQGLMKSALVATLARPERIIGFARAEVRERAAAYFYSQSVTAGIAHAVDRNLALAEAAGANSLLRQFPLPPGEPEGDLPPEFVLASPLAGWAGKQWPLEHYIELARSLSQEVGLPLVVNGPPAARAVLQSITGAIVHVSGIAGLIDATRRATAVIGVDSGPMHLAAALNKAGAAIFGPTDPARNGPYGTTMQVLCHATASPKLQQADRRSGAYIRSAEIDPAMRAIVPAAVVQTLKAALNATLNTALNAKAACPA